MILETVEMTHELDDTGLQGITPFFDQHGHAQVERSLRDSSQSSATTLTIDPTAQHSTSPCCRSAPHLSPARTNRRRPRIKGITQQLLDIVPMPARQLTTSPRILPFRARSPARGLVSCFVTAFGADIVRPIHPA